MAQHTKIAIIGGAGKMGRWLAGFLARDGKPVIIAGRDSHKLAVVSSQLDVEVAPLKTAAAADIIILSLPIDRIEPVIKEISPRSANQALG